MRSLAHLLCCLLLAFGLLTIAPHHEQLYILPSSTLTISGSSNVTDFNCCCDEEFTPVSYQMETLSTTQMRLSETLLRIPVQALDCGNRIMNKDMRQSLCADDYPYIDIRPLSIQLHTTMPAPIGQWINLMVETDITLAGATQRIELYVTARRLTEKRWQIRNQKALCMIDFGIEPPTAMGGLIKVKDEITINIDLFVEKY